MRSSEPSEKHAGRELALRLWCCLLLLTVSARAQPESTDAARSGASPPPAQATPSTDAPSPPANGQQAAPEAVTAPRLIGEAIVEYPAGATGTADVVLELVIGVTGEVQEARVVEGVEPFASAALSRARRAHSFSDQLRASATTRGSNGRAHAASYFKGPSSGTATRAGEPIEVTVHGDRDEPRAQTLTRAEVRQLPGAFGDPFRAIEALPGVTPIVSGVPFFYVRGAPPGNVGYFLDGIRLPLLYHVGLGPSVVHPAMVSRVDLYSGAYPTRYGRLSGGIVAGEGTISSERAIASANPTRSASLRSARSITLERKRTTPTTICPEMGEFSLERLLLGSGHATTSIFKGMITFHKQSAPHKLVTLASGEDAKVPGQRLSRLLVLDE